MRDDADLLFRALADPIPWVRIEKAHVFGTPQGEQTPAELFDGRSQLLVYHFLFGPTWTAGCPTCTPHAESFDRAIIHLNQCAVTMVRASRGPLVLPAPPQGSGGLRSRPADRRARPDEKQREL
ncbi:MAG: DUF899 family protein [Steroidobacteraceae bacterium]